jgi:riboflavin kinase/FMN adenylyltransferase
VRLQTNQIIYGTGLNDFAPEELQIMKYWNHTLDFYVEEDSVITLGKFDGLHRGHELLIEQIKEQEKQYGLKTIVFTFDIPPRKQTDGAPVKVITTNEEKRFIFEQTGIDYLIECPFTKEVMCMEPEAFIRWMVERLSVKCFVVGDDFCFGYQRMGNHEVLKQFERTYGYRTIVMPKVKEDNRDISSTFVREEIEKGNIAKVNHLLGYPFFAKSNVIHGNRIGRTMGIPTINMAIPEQKMIPPYGVYITRALIEGNWYKGVSNIGKKPTISGDNTLGLETFLLDFDKDVYEENVLVEFLGYIRAERKFDTLGELQNQIEQDIEKTREFYAQQNI